MTMRFLCLIFLITACGTEHYPLHELRKSQLKIGGFEEWVEEFEHDSGSYGTQVKVKDLIIKFEEIPQKDPNLIILGLCSTRKRKTPVITIDPIHWEYRDYTARKILMYHELGHCVLKRGHIESVDSLMNPMVTSGYSFNNDPDYYLSELFNPFVSLSLVHNDTCYDQH
jgi:hypothetical protein